MKRKAKEAGHKWVNWLLLAGGLVGMYFAYKKLIAPKISSLVIKPARPGQPTRDRVSSDAQAESESVKKGKKVETLVKPISAPLAQGYNYVVAKPSKDVNGAYVFVPKIDGVFTRRLLISGNKVYAEINPA